MQKLTLDALGRLSADDFQSAPKLPVVLVLDQVRSALNVGSIFRTADAFALEAIFLCGITAQPPHREILKTALGSTDTVAWRYFDTTHAALDALDAEERTLLAIEQTSHPTWLYNVDFLAEKKYAFVLGNEVEGVDATVLARCHAAVEIPQFGTKHSLNVAVAAGIVAWECARKWQVGGDSTK
jgi:23S rRNA (guanosine2251-2'-O)-methyltransferase